MESFSLADRNFTNEIQFLASRSSGPGGQNVNKVSSKIELRFHVASSEVLSSEEKDTLLTVLAVKINTDGFLILQSQTSRSQLKNKELVVEKFLKLITKALTPKIKRKATKPTLVSKEKRLNDKRLNSQRKNARKLPME